MLTPTLMLTIKNGLNGVWSSAFRRYGRSSRMRLKAELSICSRVSLLVCVLLVAGCKPAGPSALLQGEKLVERGKYLQALESLRRAVSLMPTNAPAWNYLGLALHYSGKSEEAQKAYVQALLLNHDLSEAHYNLGCLLLEQNKPENARSELMAYTLRRGNSADSLLKLGLAQVRSRDLAGADKSFNEVLRLSPQNPQALNGIGLVRFQQKRVTEAAQCFNATLKQRADFAPAVLNLAILSHQNPQDHAGALRLYKQYVALKPLGNVDDVNLLIRQLEQELAPPRPAVVPVTPGTPTTQMTQVTRTMPATNPPAPRSTAVVSNRVAPPVAKTETASPPKTLVASNPAPKPVAATPPPPVTPAPPPREKVPVEVLQAEPQIKVAQDSQPARSERVAIPPELAPTVSGSNSDAPGPGRYKYVIPVKQPAGNRTAAEKLFRSGAQAQQERRLADAIAAYSKATQLDPAYFEAYYNLALAAGEMGNTQASLTAYERALTVQPDSPDARYSFALALKQANYLTDAANELEKLLAKYPNDGRAHLALGNLYAQNFDEPNKARQHYIKALDTDPQSPQAGAVRYWLAAHPQ